MNGVHLIAFGLLVLLLLPVAVAAWEDKRPPDALYLAIALSGAGFAGVTEGFPGVVKALATGLACLLLVAATITAIRDRWQVRLLLGNHIKLLAAGATWLGISGASLMLLLAALLFLFSIAILRARKMPEMRPNFSHIAVIAILCVQIERSLMI